MMKHGTGKSSKPFVRAAAAMLAALMTAALFPEPAGAVDSSLSYSYVYDNWDAAVDIPSPYSVSFQIDAAALGAGALSAPSGMYISGNRLFICDTGGGRVIELSIGEGGCSLTRIIGDDEPFELKSPTDVCLCDEGLIIADGGNNRILVVDESLPVVRALCAAEAFGHGRAPLCAGEEREQGPHGI